MYKILLTPGFSYLDQHRVSDIELCNFVGLDTYKSLYALDNNLYVEVTYPMTPKTDNLNQLKLAITLNDNITSLEIKKRLVYKYIHGYDNKSSDIITRLIGSSPPMERIGVSPSAFWLWTLFNFIFIFITVLVLVIYIYPETMTMNVNYYKMKCLKHCYPSRMEI